MSGMLICTRVSLSDVVEAWKIMRVEVEISDLPEGAYFIDKGCVEVEAVLRKDPRYEQCVVKRQHFGGDYTLDPFVIQDLDGEDLTTLNTWEVDALNDSELLSYADVQIRRERHTYSGTLLLFIFSVILLAPFAAVFSIMTIILYSSSVGSVMSDIAIVSSLLLLLSVANYYRRRKDTTSKKRQIDITAARESLSFLDALRRLASLCDIDETEKQEYSKRVQYTESELAGVR
jgi:hypothetical protein